MISFLLLTPPEAGHRELPKGRGSGATLTLVWKLELESYMLTRKALMHCRLLKFSPGILGRHLRTVEAYSTAYLHTGLTRIWLQEADTWLRTHTTKPLNIYISRIKTPDQFPFPSRYALASKVLRYWKRGHGSSLAPRPTPGGQGWVPRRKAAPLLIERQG